MVRLGIRENLTEDDKLPEKPEDVEWKTLFRLSELHSLAAVTFRALQNSGLRPDEETFAAWKKSSEICVLADTQQLFAWEELKELCAEKGFRFFAAERAAPEISLSGNLPPPDGRSGYSLRKKSISGA